MKKKLFVGALAGILAFGVVIAPSLSARAEESKTIQYDDADKAKFQPLIDAMIEATKIDAFGKPTYTWILPDMTDFVNEKIPNMTKDESEYDVTWKDGRTPTKEKVVNYQGRNGDAFGTITLIDRFWNDGTVDTENRAGYGVIYGIDNIHSVETADTVTSSGYISSHVEYHDQNALGELSSLKSTLKMVDDTDVVNFMNTEREVGLSRRYVFDDGSNLLFTPNGNVAYVGGSPYESVDGVIEYYFRNHEIRLFYGNGTCDGVTYVTRYSPTDMYRLYNPNSGEHFYTANRQEADGLVAVGWHDEGLGWKAPLMSDTPVFRLYNPNSGDHHYTPDEEEKDNLIAAGWNDEGVGWYSFERKTTKLFRLYNPNEKTGTHHYTTDEGERDSLVKQGWVDEGIGWYGM